MTDVPRHEIEVPLRSSIYKIRHITDTHHGADGFNSKLFNRFRQLQIRDANSKWLHTGDIIDVDRPSLREIKARMYCDRKEALAHEDKNNIHWLEREIVPIYKPLASSCLGIIDGDHYLIFANGMTSGEWLARRLKIPYIGERSGFVNVVFASKGTHERRQYVIHARHGKGGTANNGSDANALVRQEVSFTADLHLGGHTHRENVHPTRVRSLSTHGHITDKINWYMRGGSFLDNPKYAIKAEYSPLPCGWGEVEITLARHQSFKGSAKPLVIDSVKASLVAA